MKQTLGIAMIAQNEQLHMPVSISQFFHIADDVVVVDGGSSDETTEWARRMGARVFHRPFDFNFGAQKNFAIEQLKTDWVYLHDPDERLEPTLLEVIKPIIEGDPIFLAAEILTNLDLDCIGIPRKNFIDGVQTDVYPDYQYRLFRNNCRYEGKVHEEIKGWRKDSRTEIDYKRIEEEKLPGRFNILHYKSSVKQIRQNEMYEKITKGEL